MAVFGSLAVVPWILFAQSAWDMDVMPAITATRLREAAVAVEVRDRGEVFGRDATLRARETLRDIHVRHRAAILVETVRSLGGARVADVARRRAGVVKPDRLYILVAGDEREVGVIGARYGPASRLTDRDRETIRHAFLEPLREDKPVEAIDRGVRAIGTTLDAAAGPTSSVPRVLTSGAILMILFASWIWMRIRRLGDRGLAGTIRDTPCDPFGGAWPAVPGAMPPPRFARRRAAKPELSRSPAAPPCNQPLSSSAGRCRQLEAR